MPHNIPFNKTHCIPFCTAGLTLVELLVGLLLTSLILVIGLQLYQQLARHNHFILAWSDIEDEAYLANNILPLRLANHGYLGCAEFAKPHPLSVHAPPGVYFAHQKKGIIIIPYEDKTMFAMLPSAVKRRAVAASDILILQQLAPPWLQVVKAKKGTKEIVVQATQLNHIPGWWVIGDCQHVDFFQVKKQICQKHICQLQLKQPLSDSFKQQAWVGHFMQQAWFVGKTAYYHGDKQRVTALYALVFGKRAQEIVPGMIAWRIHYLPTSIHHIIIEYLLKSLHKQVNRSKRKVKYLFAKAYTLKENYVYEKQKMRL